MVYDVDGPRVRLGLAWFAVLVVALALGRYGVAVVVAVTAAGAATQTARAWRRRRLRPHRRVAGLGAAALPLAAAVGGPVLGAAVVGLAAAAVYATRGGRPGLSGWFGDVGLTLQSSLFVGLAGASLVLTRHYSLGAAVTLVVLVSAYEVGDYLIGSGASHPYEGPLAGVVALVVTALVVAVSGIAPIEGLDLAAFIALAAVTCPAGQLVASALLPSAGSPAPALRRLDSLLVLAPLWVLLLGRYLG